MSKPEIENLIARMKGFPLTKYQLQLSKTEFVKLLEYVQELEDRLNSSLEVKLDPTRCDELKYNEDE